jgi:uncharacterized protein YkwD
MREKARHFPLLLLLLAMPAAVAESTAEKVLEKVQEERRRSGAEELARRPDLDGVARARAERIAGLPHEERLSLGESIEAKLQEAGIKAFRQAALHLDMVRGYDDPAEGFLRSWRGYGSAWSRVLDPRYRRVGIATHVADDGWVILVAIMLEELPEPGDPRELEGRTVEEVNRIRRERGLAGLRISASLAAVARAHSEDMARRGYCDHLSPDGLRAQDRVEAAGIAFRALAENIQLNQLFDDPVRQAVDSWFKSEGHRKNLLDPIYSETGVGVAVDESGKIYFTQLFMRPVGE